jgi:hypothetical protein
MDLSGSIKEYNVVEDMMRVRSGTSRKRRRSQHRSNESSEAQMSQKEPSSHISKKKYTENGTEIVRLDDPNDPIEDDYYKQKPQLQRTPTSTNIEIVINSSAPAPAYEGSAFRKEARPRTNGSTSREAQTDRTSKFFHPQNPDTAVIRTRGNSHPINESSSDGKPEPSSTKPNLGSDRRGAAHSPNTEEDFDDSIDQLAMPQALDQDTAARETAQDLLARRQISKTSSAPKRRAAQVQNVDLTSEDDEDELQTQKYADIKPITFITSTKPKLKQKKQEEERYDMFEVFSQSQRWLLLEERNSWYLYFGINHNEAASLIVDRGDSIPICLPLNSIKRVFWQRGNPRIFIHKASGNDFLQESQIYITLKSADQSAKLAKLLQSPTVNVIHKERLVSTLGLSDKSANHPP